MVMLILGLHALIFSSSFLYTKCLVCTIYIHSPSKGFVYSHRCNELKEA